jgi:outer membrane protein insertion porin family
MIRILPVILLTIMSFSLRATPALSADEVVAKMTVRGNGKVESSAILTLLESKEGSPLKPDQVRNDIKILYDLGYFSDVQIFKKAVAGGVELIVQVVEKPAIMTITFTGLEEITEETIKEKMETKLYTIVNESTITTDLRMIETQYVEKGFYLATVTYKLDKLNENEVALTFIISEGGKVLVGDVAVLGNQYFTDADIIGKFASQPYSRGAAFTNGPLYQDEKVKRDLEFLSYYYRDQGFAEVKVAKPISFLDPDRQFVRLTFQVEEGIQYNVGKIAVTGDLLFPEAELIAAMKLKPGGLFRHSWFLQNDLEMLMNKYRDLGYAYVDIDPKTTLDRERKIVDINYVIAKGEKVYFGEMTIVGNTKTRDNVIRREMKVADAELFHGTNLSDTKKNINRLGFFEEVQIIEERDKDDEKLLNLKVRVKETHTGQLQAAVGYTPGGETKASWFGQGKYDEKNQHGKGWNTSFTGQFKNSKNYQLELGFTDPRVNDSEWSLGIDGTYEEKEATYSQGVNFTETQTRVGVTVGRKIIELIRGSLTLERTLTVQKTDEFILDQFRSDGFMNSAILGLNRREVDNYLDPSDGSLLSVSHRFTGGPILHGDYQFMETFAAASYYYPIDFSDTYRTYFKLDVHLGRLWPSGDEKIPFSRRYRLGGFKDIRGFDYDSIGPKFRILSAPGDSATEYSKGGDKELYFQLEYFLPLIQEAKIKALVFGDMGRVYDEDEAIQLSGFSKDVGVGLRWITPIAPFRFEWAYPIQEDGSLGDVKVIFNIGY